MHSLSIFARPPQQRMVQNLRADPALSLSLVGGPLMGKSLFLAHVAEALAADGGGRPVVQIDCMRVRAGERPPVAPAAGGEWIVLLDHVDEIARWRDEDRRVWADWITQPQPERGLLLASRRPLYEMAADSAAGAAIPYVQQSFLGLIDADESMRVVGAATLAHPGSESLTVSVVEWCGGHPFLLDRVSELLADVVGMLPPGQTIGALHAPLLRLRLAAAYGWPLFDRQWQAVVASGAQEKPIVAVLRLLLCRPLRFDELSPLQVAPMNWLLVQGLVGIDGHSYRIFSPLFQEYLAPKLQVDPPVSTTGVADQDAVHALVKRESHRFTPQEKSLLLYFLERPGVIVSVDELLAEVWRRPDGSSRRVQEGIRRLRRRLAEFNGVMGAIDNEWGQGYRYVPVKRLDEN